MVIKLKERKIAILKDLETKSTFKIGGNDLTFMKVDVEGLAVRPKKVEGAAEEPKLIKVMIPEERVPVLCLNTGKAQFLRMDEKVEIVELNCVEVLA
jgi:hypothetical protein